MTALSKPKGLIHAVLMSTRSQLPRAMFACLGVYILMLPGCLTSDPVTWEVDVGGLDFIQLTSVPDREKGASSAKRVTRLELLGNGHLSLERGASSRVEDAFWTRREDPNWHDLRRDNLMLTERQTTQCFQTLVDAGFFGADFKKKQEKEGSKDLLVYSRIGKRHNASVTDDEALVRLYRDMLKHFR